MAIKRIVSTLAEAQLNGMVAIENDTLEALEPRPRFRSMWRGFVGRCPHCGKGRLFGRYLKPVAACSVCGEDFTHQRADDAPPYFTMVIVGHILVPLVLAVQLNTDFTSTTYVLMWVPLTGFLALGLLQPVKGATIALQWALRIHGFDGKPESVEGQSFP